MIAETGTILMFKRTEHKAAMQRTAFSKQRDCDSLIPYKSEVSQPFQIRTRTMLVSTAYQEKGKGSVAPCDNVPLNLSAQRAWSQRCIRSQSELKLFPTATPCPEGKHLDQLWDYSWPAIRCVRKHSVSHEDESTLKNYRVRM